MVFANFPRMFRAAGGSGLRSLPVGLLGFPAMSNNSTAPPRKFSGQKIFLGAAIVVSLLVLIALVPLSRRGGPGRVEAAMSQLRLEDIPFDGTQAYEYLKQLCAIGPRPSASAGMAAQQKLLAAHFQKFGGQVEFQQFTARHPSDGSQVPMANLIVHWNPQSKKRVLLCAHYDTLPFPLRDPQNPRGVFIGANDGGSGVAVLMELAREMAQRRSQYGVDFALFDGEEFIFSEQQEYFLGSKHFAHTYAAGRPSYRYRWGVLLDMVGDSDLQIHREGNSASWRDTRPLVESIWATAARLGVQEFIPRTKFEIRDDHVPLHDIGRIPTCDIIDFDYSPWHTQEDTLDKCSALSLAKVGWVIGEWLKTLEQQD